MADLNGKDGSNGGNDRHRDGGPTARLFLLGRQLEADPESASEAIVAIPKDERSSLSKWGQARVYALYEQLAMTLDKAESAPALLADLPLLCDDPSAAEVLQRRVADALVAREMIHRMTLCVRALAEGDETLEPTHTLIDERLRRALPTWRAVTPFLARMAIDLGVAASEEGRWWLCLPTERDEVDAVEDSNAFHLEQLADWIRLHVVEEDGRLKLQLSNREGRELFSTAEGKRLARHLADKIEFEEMEKE